MAKAAVPRNWANESAFGCLYKSSIDEFGMPSTRLAKIAPENGRFAPKGKERIIFFQPSIFRCELLVSGRVYNS